MGKTNAPEYVDQEVWRKRRLTGQDSIAPDQRDLGRGIIHTSEYYSSKGQYLYKSIQEMLEVRSLHFGSNMNGIQVVAKPDSWVIGFTHLTHPQMTVYANPAHEFARIPFEHEGQIVFNCNQARIESHELLLPPRSGVWVQAKP